MQNRTDIEKCRGYVIGFINQTLKLTINSHNDIVVPVKQGVHFLGCDIYPTGKRLRKRIYARIEQR